MGDKTGISWTNSTWNPVRGCSRVSEGCRNCYAESVAYRFSGAGQPYEGLAVLKNGHASWTEKIQFVKEHLLDPMRWTKPRRIFVNSMSDLFHPKVTDEMRDKIFAVMALAPQHMFQILTKRPELMLPYVSSPETRQRIGLMSIDVAPLKPGKSRMLPLEHRPDSTDADPRFWATWPLPNVWLGVSTEDQKTADRRIPLLLETPAAIRFISAEPLLGPIDLRQWIGSECRHDDSYSEMDTNATVCRKCDESAFLDWVIVGGESGPHARPMISSWADSIREQCEAARVAFFFKQNGEWIDCGHEEFGKLPTAPLAYLNSQGISWGKDVPLDEDSDVHTMKRVGKKRAGDTLYGKIYHEFPV